ncbi:D-2-hydroxyacid dehydrogenase, partial [Chloroflexota bacterium]
MAKLNVLITTNLEDDCLRRVVDANPQIKLRDASDLTAAETRRDYSSKDQLDAMLAEAEVIHGSQMPQNVIARSPKLKWIHTRLAGVDRFITDEIARSSVILTNGKGIHTTPCAEVAIEMMLMFTKNAPQYFQYKQERKWHKLHPGLLRSKTVGIVGLGSIGTEVARLARAFRMRVVAVRRSVKKVTQGKYADVIFPGEQLPEMLSESDYVVLALPFTPETDKLIGENELRAMKPGAYLINVGRGDTIDEDMLVHALEEKWIAGAGLDAFAVEP